MFSYPAVSGARQFIALAKRLGVTVPEPIIEGMKPEHHPRARLTEYTGTAYTGTTSGLATAIQTALVAGRNPLEDDDVQRAIQVQAIWGHTGDLDLAQNVRIAALFTEHWDDIVDAVDAIYAPAARALHDAHDALSAARLDHDDTDAIRRTGGRPLAAWAAALAAQDVYAHVPQLMTHAHLTASNTLVSNGSRAHWGVTPCLDTWVTEAPKVPDVWAVLKSGATLSLARTRAEAEGRAQMVNRERALASQARRDAAQANGFGVAPDNGTVTYTGIDGQRRTIADGQNIRVISTRRNAFGTEVEV